MICTIKRFQKIFSDGNVCVCGLRGTGKDMLMANVIARNKKPYISNADYKVKKSVYIPLKFNNLNCKNNFKNFIEEDIVPYDYPYPENCDIYISDAGVVFPSQYNEQLNRAYPQIPVFNALSRHLGNCNVHFNVQNLNRVWDKFREQSDIYLRCTSCKVFGKIVIQVVYYYDKYDSCLNRVECFRPINPPVTASREVRESFRLKNEELLRAFKEKNGIVRKYIMIYKNKSNYDTRLFKNLLKGDKTNG